MSVLVSADEVREALNLQGFYVADQVLTDCIDSAEAVIIPLLKTGVDYSTHVNVIQAITFVACDVYQARNSANGQAMAMDGTLLPYRAGRGLTSRVMGLLAPDLNVGVLAG